MCINGGRNFLHKVKIYFYWLKATFKEVECQKRGEKKRSEPLFCLRDERYRSQKMSKLVQDHTQEQGPVTNTSPTFQGSIIFSITTVSLLQRCVYYKFLMECIL